MKAFFLLVAIIVILPLTASSQSISFGVGANLTFPSASLKDNVATGYGAAGLVKIGVPFVDLTGGVEYIKFTDKDITIGNLTQTGTGSAFGLLVGGRLGVFVIGYVGAETGTYTFTKTVAGSDNSYTKGFFAPMIGINLAMFDISARYVSAGDDSFYGLRGLLWF